MRSWVVGLLFSVLMLALLATKSRLLLLYVAVLLPVYACTEPKWSARRAMLLVLGGAIVLWTLGVWIALNGTDSVQQLAWTYGTLDPTGAGTASDTLNGRTPLWEQMIVYASQRPWLGYGFGAFWTPDQLQAVWRVLTWKPPIGHNGFLDEILGTGVVGLVLFLLAWLTAIKTCIELKASRRSALGGLAAVWLVMFLFMNAGDSIMQTYFQFPFFASLTAVFAVLGSQVRTVPRAAPAQAHWSYRTS
jgi:O-antigen ligase